MTMYASIDTVWNDLMVRARSSPVIESRAGPMREMLGVEFTLLPGAHTWLQAPCRKLSKRYMTGELAWYLSGSSDIEFMTHYAKQYARFGEVNGHAWGAYGKRWAPQWPGLIHELKARNTRRAVLTAYDGIRDLDDRRDIPCTLSLHFIPRDGALNLVATMRSNDLWLGMPYDVYAFHTLMRLLANHTGLEEGWYKHQVGSMHLYEADFEKYRKDDYVTVARPGKPEYAFEDWVTTFCHLERQHRLHGEKLLTTDSLINELIEAL